MGVRYHTVLHYHERRTDQLDGSRLQGYNCTCAAGGSLTFRHTHGAKHFSGARVRAATYDTSGGTNLMQVKTALARLGITGFYGPFHGMALATFYNQLRLNQRGAIVQGASSATRGTRWQASSTFGGNHAWYCGAGRGWFRSSSGVYLPRELKVWDPLADGRRSGIATSPFWLPRSYFETFLRRLDIGSTLLGPGKVYALFSRDTWRHTHRRYGAASITPAKIRLRGGYNIRTSPGGTKVATTAGGDDYFEAWQRTDAGPSMGGSRVWYGNHKGDRWIHASARA